MEPVVVTMGNLLLALWIVGGFVALLLLNPEEREVEASEAEELLGLDRPNAPTAAPAEPARPRHPAAVPDAYWMRPRTPDPVTRDKAA